jgi:2-polyprenyl-3-methyl-5-hydroxy-6-metoxy-1,4-benzoquinol methylase
LEIAATGVTKQLLETQLSVFPAHQQYLNRRFAGTTADELAFLEQLAILIAKVIDGNVIGYADDYRWLAEAVVDEEIEFRRSGKYRFTSFDEVEKVVYADKVFMTRYMNGLLLSQLWWRNHTDVMRFFCEQYLPGNREGFRHLEIGPGHGLFLYFAAASKNCGSATGWDISPASIDLVRKVHGVIGLNRPVSLELVNIFEGPSARFDSVTFSEVLEHLEEPRRALEVIYDLLEPNGRAFINAPVNSPAPDHISLFGSPEEIVEMIREAGFEVEQTLFAPTTGATLERARKVRLAISTAVIARKPEKKY